MMRSAFLLLSISFTLVSCGSTVRATVVAKENNTTRISITTNNPTTVDTSADVDTNINVK